jgi:hypothetical protein
MMLGWNGCWKHTDIWLETYIITKCYKYISKYEKVLLTNAHISRLALGAFDRYLPWGVGEKFSLFMYQKNQWTTPQGFALKSQYAVMPELTFF